MEIRVTNIKVELDKIPVDKVRVHRAMAQAYLKLVQETFGPSGVNRESPWPPLSPRYKDFLEKTRFGFGGRFLVPTLYRSGKLYRSISASADSQAGHVISQGVDYAWVHQQGGENTNSRGAVGETPSGKKVFYAPPATIPRRPFFPFDRAGNPTQAAIQTVQNAALKALNSA